MENQKPNSISKVHNLIIEKGLRFIPLGFILVAVIIKFFSFQIGSVELFYIGVHKFLSEIIFTQTRLEMLSTISVVLIGFNVTIMSVFGSSYSQAIIRISEENLSANFITYSKNSLVASFVFFIITMFFDAIPLEFFIFIYTTSFLTIIVEFIRFTAVVLKMYEVNIDSASDAVKIQEEERKELIGLLREIKDIYSIQNIQSNTDHYDKMKEAMKKEKKTAKKI
ncbi:hypothetical protein SAMN05660297_02759 [Natronincola peptidivorans]|uniref:Uncharacterized protein n=1 Tax=Natronincola peptidivorans TaxID=426128 RepID=A0A1I0FCI0_9FIRM|nr:hypothetical protein [Natronincola peptidivorans]SET55845.1 hypothetical protein SAMN05660297_02759 [Natronincola peptidivorans]